MLFNQSIIMGKVMNYLKNYKVKLKVKNHQKSGQIFLKELNYSSHVLQTKQKVKDKIKWEVK